MNPPNGPEAKKDERKPLRVRKAWARKSVSLRRPAPEESTGPPPLIKTSAMQKPKTPPPIPLFTPLDNPKKRSFCNTAVQALCSLPVVRRWIVDEVAPYDSFKFDIPDEVRHTFGAIFKSRANDEPPRSAHSLISFISCFGDYNFTAEREHDSAHFLRSLISCSSLKDFLGLTEQETMTCFHCQHQVWKKESFHIHTLDLIRPLEGEKTFHQLLKDRLDYDFVVILRLYTKSGSVYVKHQGGVTEWDQEHFSIGGVSYRVTAAVEHIERDSPSPNLGFYVAYIRHPRKVGWLRICDAHAEEVEFLPVGLQNICYLVLTSNPATSTSPGPSTHHTAASEGTASTDQDHTYATNGTACSDDAPSATTSANDASTSTTTTATMEYDA